MMLSRNAENVITWLRADTELRGGKGRRLSRIQSEVGLTDSETRSALRELEDCGLIEINDDNPFGFIYARLVQ